jgi:hypothetical protein
MKNLVYMLVSIAVLLFAACGGSSSDDEGGSTPAGSTSPNGQTYQQSVTLSATDADKTVTLNKLTSAIQTYSGGADWLTVLKENYISGSPALRLKATNNERDGETTQARSCNVTIVSTSGNKVILTVTQDGAERKAGIDDSHDVVSDQPAYSR